MQKDTLKSDSSDGSVLSELDIVRSSEFKQLQPPSSPSSSSTATTDTEASPSPLSNGDIATTSSRALLKPTVRHRRGGITFLSGDPMKIGLIGKKGNLSTVVRALQQKKLLRKQNAGTLEKSRLDWVEFKKDEGIEAELRTQIKSKTGYLERQDFLQRTDLREFEIEKEMRAKRRRQTIPDL